MCRWSFRGEIEYLAVEAVDLRRRGQRPLLRVRAVPGGYLNVGARRRPGVLHSEDDLIVAAVDEGVGFVLVQHRKPLLVDAAVGRGLGYVLAALAALIGQVEHLAAALVRDGVADRLLAVELRAARPLERPLLIEVLLIRRLHLHIGVVVVGFALHARRHAGNVHRRKGVGLAVQRRVGLGDQFPVDDVVVVPQTQAANVGGIIVRTEARKVVDRIGSVVRLFPDAHGDVGIVAAPEGIGAVLVGAHIPLLAGLILIGILLQHQPSFCIGAREVDIGSFLVVHRNKLIIVSGFIGIDVFEPPSVSRIGNLAVPNAEPVA